MTNKELVRTFIGYYAMRQTSGDQLSDGEIAPILPFILMDVGWQPYRDNIAKTIFSFKTKKEAREWKSAYDSFMKYLFRPYGDDATDAVIEKMDEISAALQNPITIMRVKFMDVFKGDATLDQQLILAAALTCNVVAQMAEHSFDELYGHKGLLLGRCRSDLHAIRVHAREFTIAFMKQNGIPNADISDEDNKKLSDAVDSLERQIVRWLKNERQ